MIGKKMSNVISAFRCLRKEPKFSDEAVVKGYK